MNRLHKYLPSYYKNSKVFDEITRVESDEFDKLDLDIEDLSLQFVVDTATWGLAIYEKELQLPIRPNKTLDERRSIIKAKMRGIGKVDSIMLKLIIGLFTDTPVEIGFDGKINYIFDGLGNTQISSLDMLNAIEEVKPAHLGQKFIVNHSEKINLYFGTVIRSLKNLTFKPHQLQDISITQSLYAGTTTRQSKKLALNPAILSDNITLTRNIYPSTVRTQSKQVVMKPILPDNKKEIKENINIIGVNKRVYKMTIK